jgi:hypothetical protein
MKGELTEGAVERHAEEFRSESWLLRLNSLGV